MDSSLHHVRRAKDGAADAVDALLAMHVPGLKAFVQQRAGDMLQAKESVMDLVQSTCREVLQALPEHDYEDEIHFRNWLYQAALRKIVDRARYWQAERREVGREAKGNAAEDEHASRVLADFRNDETPSIAAMTREDLSRMEAALGRLPRQQRDVIVMARLMALPHAEISAQLGKTEEATRALLYRAMKALDRELAE